jgi:hypothetical protein
MMTSSGSYFLLKIIMILWILVLWVLNILARICPKFRAARLIGIYAYKENPLKDLKDGSLKLLIENYFNLSVAALLNIHAF